MPHSSGGGSSSGGSHGGSHSSSHSSGGSRSAPSVSSRPFPGAIRYRYRRHGRYRYFYSKEEPKKLFHPARLLISIFYIPFFAMAFAGIKAPLQTFYKDYDRTIIIKDEAHVLRENSGLEDALNKFYQKCKIPPAVITVHNEDWYGNWNTLENYAYERYLQEFDDEMHWLIVYSESTAPSPDTGKYEWFWEGMQGDDTDMFLTEKVADNFTNQFQRGLKSDPDDVTGSLTAAFNSTTELIKKRGVIPPITAMLPGLFISLFVGVHAFFIMGLNDLKYRKAEVDPDNPDPIPEETPALSETNITDPAHPFGEQRNPFGVSPPQRSMNPQQPIGMRQQRTSGTPEMQELITPQAQPFNTPQAQPFDTPQTQPFNTPQAQPFDTPQTQPVGTPQTQTLGTQQTQPFGTPQTQPFGAQQTQPFGTPQTQPFGTPQTQAFGTPQTQAFGTPQTQAFETPEQAFSALQQQAFDTQQKAFEAQQEAFRAQQAAFDLHQQSALPDIQPSTPAFDIPELHIPQSTEPQQELCRYCGMHYTPGIKYCPGCGSQLK